MKSYYLNVRMDPDMGRRIGHLGLYFGGRSPFVRTAVKLADAIMTHAELLDAGLGRDDERVQHMTYEITEIIAIITDTVTEKRRPDSNPDGAKTSSLGRAENEVREG